MVFEKGVGKVNTQQRRRMGERFITYFEYIKKVTMENGKNRWGTD